MHAIGRKLLFGGGIVAVAVALGPPLSGAARQLFAAHMLQHLLLIAVAAPLLAAGVSLASLRRTSLLDALLHPVTAWTAFVAIFLFWHWPAAFRWADQGSMTVLLEQGSILASAFLFWSAVLSPPDQARLSYGARALMVMTAAVATDLPGVIMVFAPHAFCAAPGENAGYWGLTPLEDQQIAGLLMWVPANLLFFSIATFLFGRWISDSAPSSIQHPVTP